MRPACAEAVGARHRHGLGVYVAHKHAYDLVQWVVRLELLAGDGRGPPFLFHDLRRLPRPRVGAAKNYLYLGHEPHDPPAACRKRYFPLDGNGRFESSGQRSASRSYATACRTM